MVMVVLGEHFNPMNILSTRELKKMFGWSNKTWIRDVIWKDEGDYYHLPKFIVSHVPRAIRIKKIARNQWAFIYKNNHQASYR